MPHIIKRSLLFITFTFFSFAAYAYYPITVKQAHGDIKVNHEPTKVVVYDLAALDTLNALDIEAVAVAKGIFPEYLSAYDNNKKTIAGSLFDPNYDVLKNIQPDLIIVGERTKRAIPELSKIAPTIDLSVSDTAFLQRIEQNLQLLGQVFNKQKEANVLWNTLSSGIKELQQKGQQQGTGLVLFTHKDYFMSHLPGDRFGMLYELVGVKPVAQKQPVNGTKPKEKLTRAQKVAKAQIPLKARIEKQPNWLFVLDRGTATGGQSSIDKALHKTPYIEQTSAWKNNRVVYLEPTQWYVLTGGYQSVYNTVNTLNKLW